MMILLMLMFSMFSFMFATSSSPLMSVVVIISVSLAACLLMTYASYSSWFSLIFFLIFLGGLMVIFTYTCSLASNEMNSLNLKKQVVLSSIVSLVGISLTEYAYHTSTFLFVSLQSMLSDSNILIIIISIIYLLLTLVVAVLISSYKYGPIRTKKN